MRTRLHVTVRNSVGGIQHLLATPFMFKFSREMIVDLLTIYSINRPTTMDPIDVTTTPVHSLSHSVKAPAETDRFETFSDHPGISQVPD